MSLLMILGLLLAGFVIVSILSILVIGLCMAAADTREVTEDTGDYQ